MQEQASFTICAKNQEEAREGAEFMIEEYVSGSNYKDPEIVCVEEFKKDSDSTSEIPPTFN